MRLEKICSVLMILFFQLDCLKTKRSSFDSQSKQGAGSALGFLAVALPVSGSASVSTSAAPQDIKYGSTNTFKLIPGNAVNFTPTVTGTVDSWSITPDLPAGLSFNSQTGAIAGTPSTSYLSAGYPLTNFTITAKSGTASTNFTLQIQILASGENVWTVINGASGGNTMAGTNSMKYDAACNCLYIAGTTTVNLDGQTIPSTGGNESGYVSKYDLDGNRIWTRTFGVSAASQTGVTGLVTDSTGNIYLSGYGYAGNFHGCNFTTRSGFVVKYDSSGNFQWTSCSAPSSNHYYSGLMIDINGDVVAAGSTYVTPINGMSHSSCSDQAVIIQKFNPADGTRISGSIVPGNGCLGTDGYGLSSDSSGKIYVAGVSRASSYCGIGTTAYWRPVLFRFNSSMTYLGCSFIPVTSSTYSFGATATPSGESYISGYGSGTIDSIASIGTIDGYVTKFDSAGTKLWTRRIGVSGAYTAIYSVFYEAANDVIFFTGMTGGNLQGNIINGTKDMFIAKYDSSGNQIWLKMQGIQNDTLGGSLGDKTSIGFDSNKTMYSFSNTNGTVSGITNPSTPNNSFFLVRNVQ